MPSPLALLRPAQHMRDRHDGPGAGQRCGDAIGKVIELPK